MEVYDAMKKHIDDNVSLLRAEYECFCGKDDSIKPRILIYPATSLSSEYIKESFIRNGFSKTDILHDAAELSKYGHKENDTGFNLNSVSKQFCVKAGENIFAGISIIVVMSDLYSPEYDYIEARNNIYRIWNKDRTWDIFINADLII
jgi:hypothetical protein